VTTGHLERMPFVTVLRVVVEARPPSYTFCPQLYRAMSTDECFIVCMHRPIARPSVYRWKKRIRWVRLSNSTNSTVFSFWSIFSNPTRRRVVAWQTRHHNHVVPLMPHYLVSGSARPGQTPLPFRSAGRCVIYQTNLWPGPKTEHFLLFLTIC